MTVEYFFAAIMRQASSVSDSGSDFLDFEDIIATRKKRPRKRKNIFGDKQKKKEKSCELTTEEVALQGSVSTMTKNH